MILIPIVGLAIGIAIGLLFNISIPPQYSGYLSIAVLAALDTVFGGIRAAMEHHFDSKVFLTGFFFNTLMAAFLTYIGEQLGVSLYMAAVFAFGVRLFNNIATIRRLVMSRPKKNVSQTG